MNHVLRNRKWIAVLLCIAMLLAIAPFGPMAAFGEDGDGGVQVSDGVDAGSTAAVTEAADDSAGGPSAVEGADPSSTGEPDMDSSAGEPQDAPLGGGETTDVTGGNAGEPGDGTAPDTPAEEPPAGDDLDGNTPSGGEVGGDEGNGNTPSGGEVGDGNEGNGNEGTGNAPGSGAPAAGDLAEPQCTCGAVEGEAHGAECPLYVAPFQHLEGCEGDNCTLEDCQCPCHQPLEEVQCTCGAAEGEAHGEDCPLYVAPVQHLEGCEGDSCTLEDCQCPCHQQTISQEEVLALYEQLQALESEEELEAFLSGLSEAQLKALQAYVQSLQEPVHYESVSFTEAGPFLPPVEVPSIGLLRKARVFALQRALDGSATGENEGIQLSKTVSGDSESGYTLRLESYVTGQTIVTEGKKAIPVDIVLVLDQSGSMAFNFAGKDLWWWEDQTQRRQYAMKQAVNGFIGKVAEKYGEDCDNRMAIVTFADNASILQGWTAVDATGQDTLQKSINDLTDSPSGATNVAAGMEQAETLLGAGYEYTGPNTTRQKVAIVFTDGVPTTESDFDTTVATNAIASAKNLKDAGVTVYSVGIFDGVNPAQLYGEKWDYKLYDDILCTGEVETYWGGSWFSALIGGNDFKAVDIAAGNRFLNYLSSNYTDATGIGLERDEYNPGNHAAAGGTGYKITKNFDRIASDYNYYLTATNSADLTEIFQTISENIQTGTASVQLDEATVVQDVISDYFELPDGSTGADIQVSTARYNAAGTWEPDEPSNLMPTIDGKTITVSGFDFSQNYCATDYGRQDGDNNAEGDFYGRKLIVEIPIKVRAGFLGGNGVPSNGDGSGIYAEGAPMKYFESPAVHVPIGEVSVDAEDKNVYLLGGLTAAQLKADATATVGGVSLNLRADNYGLETWQNDYVDIKVEVKDKDGNTVTDITNLTEDQLYSVAVKVAPKFESTGDDVATGSKDATIKVFKPELTFHDSEVYYGQRIETYDFNTHNFYVANGQTGEVKWKHGAETVVESDIGTTPAMFGTAPTVTVSAYTPAAEAIQDGLVATRDDFYVTVSGIEVNDTPFVNSNGQTYYTVAHQACEPGCSFDANGGQFMLHVKTGALTITKAGADAIDENASFIFQVTGPLGTDLDVAVVGNGSVTVTGLPVGAYTIHEKGSWSWRYRASTVTAQLTASETGWHGSCTVQNARSSNKWLDGYGHKPNSFQAV